MTYKEPDYETVILQKLGAMEDLLRSFMSSLGESGRESYNVPAPADGKILRWNKTDGERVMQREPLCVFEPKQGRVSLVRSPARGTLRILVGVGEDVRGGWTIIARIENASVLV